MTAHDRFAAYTRSASFAFTLSAPQANRLLWYVKVTELRDKYPWYDPWPINFGEATRMASDHSDSVIRALTRRGLLDVNPTPAPCSVLDVITLTEAGRLMAAMLRIAGFEWPKVPAVPPHPDDRIKLAVRNDEVVVTERPHDRRDPADAEWFGRYPIHAG